MYFSLPWVTKRPLHLPRTPQHASIKQYGYAPDPTL